MQNNNSFLVNKKPIYNSYLLAVDNESKVLYKDSYILFIFQNSYYDFKNFLKDASYKDDVVLEFDYHIRKSDNNKLDGNFSPFGSVANENSNVKLSKDDFANMKLTKLNNSYYVDLYEIWGQKQPEGATVIINKTRGLFKHIFKVVLKQPVFSSNNVVVPDESLVKRGQVLNFHLME